MNLSQNEIESIKARGDELAEGSVNRTTLCHVLAQREMLAAKLQVEINDLKEEIEEIHRSHAGASV
jgi:hypothetical protein